MKTPDAKADKNKKVSAGGRAGSDGLEGLLLSAARMLEEAPSWNLFAHLNLDGDALGAVTALYEAGLLQGKSVRWMGPDPSAPPAYLFLPHVEKYISRKEYNFDEEDVLCVFLDSANENRGLAGFRHKSPQTVIINIDHHEDNTRFGTLNCVDPEASSTSELLWHLMAAAGWPVTPRIAESLYVGIIADTGRFAFSNTSEKTHRMAAELLALGVEPARIDAFVNQNRTLGGMRLWGIALERAVCWGAEGQFAMTWLSLEDFARTGAIPADTSMLVNQLFLIRGVCFTALLVEESDKVKVSLRSKEGTVAASSVARHLGGGGHPRASGVRLAPPLQDAVRAVRKALENAYDEWASADR